MNAGRGGVVETTCYPMIEELKNWLVVGGLQIIMALV
jgi:hypothetical protein